MDGVYGFPCRRPSDTILMHHLEPRVKTSPRYHRHNFGEYMESMGPSVSLEHGELQVCLPLPETACWRFSRQWRQLPVDRWLDSKLWYNHKTILSKSTLP